MTVTSYTDDTGFAWLIIDDANIVLGPDWSKHINDLELSKKVQNTLVKYGVYDKETFLTRVVQITNDIQDREVLRTIRSVLAQQENLNG